MAGGSGSTGIFSPGGKLGIPFLFVTNRAHRTPEGVAAHLCSLGVETGAERVFTSVMATAEYLVVGFDRSLTYEKIDKASRLIREGARFVATNTDALWRLPPTGMSRGMPPPWLRFRPLAGFSPSSRENPIVLSLSRRFDEWAASSSFLPVHDRGQSGHGYPGSGGCRTASRLV
ncbi:MAG: hypothetical protein KAH24_00640 [Holophagae bacterium]|nr:hypothetical protein [Holophagae bacterium]